MTNYKGLLLILVFLCLSIIARSDNIRIDGTDSNYHTLKIAIPPTIFYQLYDSIRLFSGVSSFNSKVDYDQESKMITYTWSMLPANVYYLTLKTVFADVESYTLNLKRDTSFIVKSNYRLTDPQDLAKTAYSKADRIRLYFESSGCFHLTVQTINIEKQCNNSYQCTFIRDSIGYKDTLGRMMIVKIPIVRTVYVNEDIIESLAKMIHISSQLQQSVSTDGPKCVSTTHEILFMLYDNRLFQFYDYGICDWEEYLLFLKKYFHH